MPRPCSRSLLLLALALALGSPGSRGSLWVAAAHAGEPEIDHVRLSNGLDLLVVEKHDAPLVTIEVAVKTGSFCETPTTNGLSHLYEHMFFKGNAALPTQERYMARVAELGIRFNGTTSTERVNYFFTLPSRNFAAGMQFMQDALLRPLFNQDELVAERRVVIGEYDRNEANPIHFLREGLREQLYGDQAYRKNPLGEREVILSATQETLRAFQAAFYRPENSCLLIVGDVNKTEARVLAERLFGPAAWASRPASSRPPLLPLPRLAETRAIVVERATPLQVLGARWPGPDVGRDERATFVADVWGTLLALPHGRFQRTFRDGGLADEVALSYLTQREGGELEFTALCREGKLLQVRDALLAEITAMAEPGYWNPSDLALAQRTLRIQRAFGAESGAELSHTLSFWWASSSLDYYRRYLAACEAVSLDELRAFVRNYLSGRPLVLGALLSPERRAALGLDAESLRPPTHPSAAAASLVEELPLGPHGLRVIFRRELGSGVSALCLGLQGGSQGLSPSAQGIDALLLESLKDGTQRVKRDELSARFAELGARLESDVNYDFAQLSLVAPREGFPAALSLLLECLREPALELRHVKQRASAQVARLLAERSDPDRSVSRVLNRAFFSGHPYANRPDGTPESLSALEPADLRARLRELLVSGRVVLTVVGDHERAWLRSLLERELEFVPAGPTLPAELPLFTPAPGLAREVRDLPTTYLLGKCAAPAPGAPDYPAARLALALLKKRLWATLRTRHSLTYAPWAGLGRSRSNYAAIYASTTEPGRALALTFSEIKLLQTELVDDAELRGLVAQEETGLATQRESALSHAIDLARAELVDGSWRSLYELPAALKQVTPSDLRRAAQTYLKEFRFGIVGPAELAPEDLVPR